MIVAERKPIDEIWEMIRAHERILVLGCGGCVTVCVTGGEKQAETLAAQLRMKAAFGAAEMKFTHKAVTRQCDREFLEEIKDDVARADAVLSMACGAGVQLLAETYEQATVLPAMNTTFLGSNTAPGIWTEYCRGCGQCMLAETGGICPIARCSKGLVNGPCGGTNDGKCEVSNEIDCAWYLIYKRLKERGRLDVMRKLRAPLDWSKTTDGVQRRLAHEELEELTEEAEAAAEASKGE